MPTALAAESATAVELPGIAGQSKPSSSHVQRTMESERTTESVARLKQKNAQRDKIPSDQPKRCTFTWDKQDNGEAGRNVLLRPRTGRLRHQVAALHRIRPP